MKIEVLFDDDRLAVYDFNIIDEIEPSFAVTIHKSQGSEFPVVVIPVFPCPGADDRETFIYCCDLAREMVVLVGFEECLCEMVGNKRETLRFSGLSDKLKAFCRICRYIIMKVG